MASDGEENSAERDPLCLVWYKEFATPIASKLSGGHFAYMLRSELLSLEKEDESLIVNTRKVPKLFLCISFNEIHDINARNGTIAARFRCYGVWHPTLQGTPESSPDKAQEWGDLPVKG